jgi:hypothetical protein
MGKTSKAGKAAGAAGSAYATARGNQYVQRIIEDEELRANLRDAYEAARHAYDRITGNGKGPVKAVTRDKKVQRDLRNAADSLREASEQLRGRRRRKSRVGRVLLLGAVAGGVVLAFSENARKTVMDTVFGAEEEFEYTSTTSSSSGSGNSSGTST